MTDKVALALGETVALLSTNTTEATLTAQKTANARKQDSARIAMRLSFNMVLPAMTDSCVNEIQNSIRIAIVLSLRCLHDTELS